MDRKNSQGMTCGFCNTGNHERCPVAVRNGSAAPNPLHFCPCTNPQCEDKQNHPHCIECKNPRSDDVDPATWSCIDPLGCKARITARVDADPVIQKIRETRERVIMVKLAENAEKPAREKAAPKVGTCLVTGEPTKGGKFKPGMDARYVSIKVEEVLGKKSTEAKVLKEMQGHGLSESLQAKFSKNLGIAQDKAAKAAQAEAAKKAEAKAGTKG